MSRSKRKNPICANTTNDSEKQDKRLYNRRFRKLCKQVLNEFDEESDVLPVLDEVVNPYSMSKDGKYWFNEAEHAELMRK